MVGVVAAADAEAMAVPADDVVAVAQLLQAQEVHACNAHGHDYNVWYTHACNCGYVCVGRAHSHRQQHQSLMR